MSETEVTVETQAKNNAIPQWRVHYNNIVAIMEENLERLREVRDAAREYRRELEKLRIE